MKKKVVDDSQRASSGTHPDMLPLLLQRSLVGTTRCLARDLHEVARLCNVARNKMLRAWLRWHEDHEGWQPPQVVDEAGVPQVDRDGQPKRESPLFPLFVYKDSGEELSSSDRQLLREQRRQETEKKRRDPRYKTVRCDLGRDYITFSTWLYHHGTQAAPEIAANIVAMLAREVESHLKASMPYNHSGQARWRWQAILCGECGTSSFESLMIPVPRSHLSLCFRNNYLLAGASKATTQQMRVHGKTDCAASFLLFSPSAGRSYNAPSVLLWHTGLTEGRKRIIEELARGSWKNADSKLVFKPHRHNDRDRRDKKERGDWFLHLSYHRPDAAQRFAAEKVAVLWAERKDAANPFTVSLLGNDVVKWQLGFGAMLERLFNRLDERRKNIRTETTLAGTGRTGHGRSRENRTGRDATRHVLNLMRHAAKKTASELVRFCERYECGTVYWSEPAIGVRSYLWHAGRGVQWDWTKFTTAVLHQCRKAGITVIDPKLEQRRAKRSSASASVV